MLTGKEISHYNILEKIGSGGMGEVYKAKDTKLKRTVALKFLPYDLTRSEDAKRRFVQEAQMASALDHPNIGVIYEIDETDDGQMFISMTNYSGETLQQRIDTSAGGLPFDEAVKIAIQMAKGLSRAHKEGITHRDIKPANVIVTEHEEVKIIDFGLAMLTGQTRLTKEGTTVGTAAYMSPEQTQGGIIDQRTDIWSLGVVLYEMLAGQLPFKGDYEQAVIYSIVNEDLEPLTTVRPDVPHQLELVVNKMLAKDPNDRYQQIDQVVTDLLAVGDAPVNFGSRRLERKQRVPKTRLLYGGIAVFVLLLMAIVTYFWQSSQLKAGQTSIAVLPLKNIAESAGQEWFSEGITEALITDLAKISGWRVISRTSAMRYKGTAKSMPEIARELAVDYIIDGSVQKLGKQVKVSARLIDAPNDNYLWAEDYDRNFRDVLSLQGEIAQAVARQVQVELTPAEKNRLASVEEVNPEAHELYLKGRYFWAKQTETSFWKSVDFYKQAIQKDRTYALAYAGMALTYSDLARTFEPPNDVMPLARVAAMKALELNESLSEAHSALAVVYFRYERNWSAAEIEIERAIELNPSSVDARAIYVIYLNTVGRHSEAIEEIKVAEQLDPLNLKWRASWGMNLIMARKYDESIRLNRRTRELEPNRSVAYALNGIAFALKGQLSDALRNYEVTDSLLQGASFSPLVLAFVAHGYAVTGQREKAMEKLALLIETGKERYVCPYETALVHMALGDYDKAFESFREAIKQNSSCVIFLKVDPRLDELRSDSRYPELLKQAGFET